MTTIPTMWRPVIGTLAHNRSFTAAEVTEYTRFDRALDGRAVLRALIRAGLVSKTEKRGRYYPTASGWNWIEQS